MTDFKATILKSGDSGTEYICIFEMGNIAEPYCLIPKYQWKNILKDLGDK